MLKMVPNNLDVRNVFAEGAGCKTFLEFRIKTFNPISFMT